MRHMSEILNNGVVRRQAGTRTLLDKPEARPPVIRRLIEEIGR